MSSGEDGLTAVFAYFNAVAQWFALPPLVDLVHLQLAPMVVIKHGVIFECTEHLVCELHGRFVARMNGDPLNPAAGPVMFTNDINRVGMRPVITLGALS